MAAGSEPVDAIPRDYNFAVDLLSKGAQRDKAAYIDPRGSWTYGQLADRVGRFSLALHHCGLRREERVFICLLDTIDWPTAFLGTLHAGLVAVPVNTLLTEDEYAFMLADSRATALVVSDALYPKFAKLIASGAFPHIRQRHRLGRDAGRPACASRPGKAHRRRIPSRSLSPAADHAR